MPERPEMTPDLPKYDPFDPSDADCDRDILSRLRTDAPIHQVLPGYFLVTRYDDVAAVELDPITFEQTALTPASVGAFENDPERRRLGELDPPQHGQIRRHLAMYVTPGRLRRFEPMIREVARDLVRKFADSDSVDLIPALADPLPANVIGRMAALPESDFNRIRLYGSDFILTLSEPDSPAGRAATGRCHEYDERILTMIRTRRESADLMVDDVLSAIMRSRDENDLPLPDRRILTIFSKDFIGAGVETTTHLIGNLFFQLARSPEWYARLRDDESLREAAIEESLRHTSPVNVNLRTATKDTELSGVAVPKGSKVILSLNSANRDENKFECPEKFDPCRSGNPRGHLAFGRGIHLCVGAPLARLETRCALDAMLDAIPGIALASDEFYERVRFPVVHGPVHLNVRIVGAT